VYKAGTIGDSNVDMMIGDGSILVSKVIKVERAVAGGKGTLGGDPESSRSPKGVAWSKEPCKVGKITLDTMF
jgi:hypothetical protein